jgi:hypothetical protein
MMLSLQKALNMVDDISLRLDKLERGEKLPLWLRQALEKSASASPAFPSISQAKASRRPSLAFLAAPAPALRRRSILPRCSRGF